MDPRRFSSLADRLILVEQLAQGHSLRRAGREVGFSRSWAKRWKRRHRAGGASALQPLVRPGPGPLATFPDAVRTATLAIRSQYPQLGARRARLLLLADPTLAGERMPSASTIHRAWMAAGLVTSTPPREHPPAAPPLPLDPDDPHAVWQIDHQDGIRLAGLAEPVVLQGMRAPAAGLIVGADLFPGPHGAHAVPMDEVLNALRRGVARFGRPRALSVDGGVHFLGRPQRSLPSRLELFCAGLGIAVVPIRPGRPTDHGAIERQHHTLDAILAGPPVADLAAAQTRLDAHVAALNTSFPSRARVCHGQPPLVAHPAAQHSGRPYDPAKEWDQFDLAAVDRLLATWRWVRKVAPNGQISFANRNIGVGRDLAGAYVDARFDPADRQVVVFAPGMTPTTLGPERLRFSCPDFTKAAILGASTVASQPPSDLGLSP